MYALCSRISLATINNNNNLTLSRRNKNIYVQEKEKKTKKKTGSYISLRRLLLSIKLTTFIYFVFIGWKIDWLIGIERVKGKNEKLFSDDNVKNKEHKKKSVVINFPSPYFGKVSKANFM